MSLEGVIQSSMEQNTVVEFVELNFIKGLEYGTSVYPVLVLQKPSIDISMTLTLIVINHFFSNCIAVFEAFCLVHSDSNRLKVRFIDQRRHV